MFKKSLTLCLALAVFTVSFSSFGIAQQTASDKEAQRERDAQIFINKLGVSKNSKVKIELKDDKKSIKGYISEINDETFVVTDKKKNATTITYSNIRKVSRDRLNTFVIIGLTVGVLIAGISICVAAGGCVD